MSKPEAPPDEEATSTLERGLGVGEADRSTGFTLVRDSLIGIIAVIFTTVVGLLLHINAAAAGFLFFVSVLFIATWRGLVPGIVSSVAATAGFNFFFLHPTGTWSISDPIDWVALVSFLIAAVLSSRLVTRARRQAESAEARRKEIAALYHLGVDLFAASTRSEALGESASKALATIDCHGGGLVLFGRSSYDQEVVTWSGKTWDDAMEDLVAGVGRHHRPVEFPARFGRDVYLPLKVRNETEGVLIVLQTTAAMRSLESVANLVALAIERDDYISRTAHLQALEESNALKTSLLRAVAHDLSTPLTAVSLQITKLKRQLQGADSVETVASIEQEIARLRRRIENLLSIGRLEGGVTRPHPEPTPAADLFRMARENLSPIVVSRHLDVHVEPDCPDLLVDPSLALEIIVNLVENAHRVSPPMEPLELSAARDPDSDMVVLEVRDRGPGFSSATLTGGQPSAAVEGNTVRRGLGLEIARSLAIASRGDLALINRPDGGAVARIRIPSTPLAMRAEVEHPEDPE